MVNELGLTQGVLTVFCDSQSAIHLTKNNRYHDKTKHIDVRRHFIRDIVVAGEIAVEKIHTSKNPADMLYQATSKYQVSALSGLGWSLQHLSALRGFIWR